MGFLKTPLSWKDYNTKENREQSLIPFLLQTSLSLSYLLHNLMSKELFGEASKRRNIKQEEKRKSNRKNWKRISDVQLYTVNFSNGEWRQHQKGGLGDIPLHLSKVKEVPMHYMIYCNEVCFITFQLKEVKVQF